MKADLEKTKIIVARLEKEAGDTRGSKAIEEKIASNMTDGDEEEDVRLLSLILV